MLKYGKSIMITIVLIKIIQQYIFVRAMQPSVF